MPLFISSGQVQSQSQSNRSCSFEKNSLQGWMRQRSKSVKFFKQEETQKETEKESRKKQANKNFREWKKSNKRAIAACIQNLFLEWN